MGGGGKGNFRAAGIFFRPLHEYFLGLIGVQEFFFIKCSLARFFFVLRPPPPPPPPHKFSNGLSLRRVRSICLLGVQVEVEGKGGMVLPIDNYMIMA